MEVKFPHQVLWLFQQFSQQHFELYLVGGCVRDLLLGRSVHDYDFTTNATPQEMIDFLQNQPCTIIPTGLKHGTITILYEKEPMEVTTYRSDGDYEDHRRPKKVQFSNHLIDDLARRDFTINAIAYHPDTGIVDPYNGQNDLSNSLIRCVGNSEERFDEDALRILRALRFSFQLQFTLEDACANAIKQKAHTLLHISKERIREEFTKMLFSDRDDLLTTLRMYGVLPYIIEELTQIYDISQESKWHIYDVFTHSDQALNHTKGYSLEEKLAVVFHDIGKAHTKTIDEQGDAHFHGHPAISAALAKDALKKLTYPNKIIKQVLPLIEYHDYYVTPNKRTLRRFLSHIDMNYELAYAILHVQYADDCAKNMCVAQEKLENIEVCVAMLKQMEQEEKALHLKDLEVNGYDMMDIGYEGKEIKEILTYLYHMVLEEPTLNKKSQLLKLAKKHDSLK